MQKPVLFRQSLVMLVSLTCFLQQSELMAHFLFIRVGEHAEAGRAAEVFFSERAAAGDPRFVEKVAGTKLLMQQKPGEFVSLSTQRGADRLRAVLPSTGAVSITGLCEYGVLKREVPFLIRYYPKAISGSISELNEFKPNPDSDLEIMATAGPQSITLVLLDRGKPVPDAVFTTVDDDLVNEELKADGDGKVTWAPSKPGSYCVYTKVVRKEAGERNGQTFSEIREFPTLYFAWPLERPTGDREAGELFSQAIAKRARWRDFPGFTATIAGHYDDRPFSGTVEIEKSGAVKLKIDQEVAATWVEEQLHSIVIHRMDSPSSAAPILRFADQDTENPLGRLLTFVGGQSASSYRVKDGQLKVVNRRQGTENMTITVLENAETPEGKFLPRLYNVQYWDASSGALLRTESFENRWKRIGAFDLPVLNSVLISSAAGLAVRRFELTNLSHSEAK
ncbi:DUF3386 family protein [Schlesneria paludicola]|uniref:DUF3386 family protein n=1 Tax=Schlesneria paludicola TaxID=360056 RepID=UPI00029AEEFB|nr:DUF3386 family protein [Schlesneria paludicola]